MTFVAFATYTGFALRDCGNKGVYGADTLSDARRGRCKTVLETALNEEMTEHVLRRLRGTDGACPGWLATCGHRRSCRPASFTCCATYFVSRPANIEMRSSVTSSRSTPPSTPPRPARRGEAALFAFVAVDDASDRGAVFSNARAKGGQAASMC